MPTSRLTSVGDLGLSQLQLFGGAFEISGTIRRRHRRPVRKGLAGGGDGGISVGRRARHHRADDLLGRRVGDLEGLGAARASPSAVDVIAVAGDHRPTIAFRQMTARDITLIRAKHTCQRFEQRWVPVKYVRPLRNFAVAGCKAELLFVAPGIGTGPGSSAACQRCLAVPGSARHSLSGYWRGCGLEAQSVVLGGAAAAGGARGRPPRSGNDRHGDVAGGSAAMAAALIQRMRSTRTQSLASVAAMSLVSR